MYCFIIYLLFNLTAIGQSAFLYTHDKTPVNSLPAPVTYAITPATDSVPDPVVRIGAHLDTVLTVGEIMYSPYLQVHLPGSSVKHQYGVHYFKLVVEYQSGDIQDFEASNSNRLSPAQLAIVKKLQSGDALFFQTIKGTHGNSETKHYPSFRVHIK
jgi:hypothetical protein